jgi:catechol 2,3-dioxygenase-like lactoylglutathione lyase family enzyme
MIKVKDIAYVRFAAPDLEAMQRFLGDFGLVADTIVADTLYARGTDASPYVHVTELGEPRFVGLAFQAESAADLEAASQLEGASAVEKIDAPGGGQRVCFEDPDGLVVEVVHGREELSPLPVLGSDPLNRGSDRQRFGKLQRLQAGPAAVKRLGHAGIHCNDIATSVGWYKARFGFISSDEVFLGDESNVVAAFMRCDRGDAFVDHHTLVCVGSGRSGLDHAAFEVEDIDSVMLGHDHLEQAGYAHAAGIGRHILGSQVFDYWDDPWGHRVEHFTDGDLLTADVPTNRAGPEIALGTQWGKFGP